jgi:endo-1,4-beta-D-glucanase Y
MFKKLFRTETLSYIALAFISLISHWNIFFYPAYREDEGTYISQAWSVINNGSLAPYTYWYDHSPVGWFLIAGWNIIAKPFLEFANIESAVNSGRLLIVIINVLSALLVYSISKHLTQNKAISFLSTVLFIATPLAIEFQRRVFLDNIMVFWLLLSIYLTISSTKLYRIVLGAIAFSIAVLSKESAIVFFPVIATSVYLNANKNNRPFVLASWFAFTISMVSFYPLYALIKGEFFQYGSFLGGDQPHVSFLQALKFQAGRSAGFFWEADSAFRRNLSNSWLNSDFIYITLGVLVAPLTNLVFFRKYKWTGFVSMMVVIYLIYLIRGQVLDWYIIPLIPLGAINIALLLHNLQITLKKRLPRLEKPLSLIGLSALTLIIVFSVYKNTNAYRYNQTENQIKAVNWIKNNIHDETTLLIDNYAFQDVNPNLKSITDTNIHYYYKADPKTDPKIAEGVFENNWKNVDYIMMTPAVKETLAIEDFQLVETALQNSRELIKYNEYAVVGDPVANYPVEIREVDNFDYRLQRTWGYYKKNFITANGQVIDPKTNLTTSEGQSYALLRAMWIGDQETFDKILKWTNENLQKPSGVYAWKIQNSVDSNKITTNKVINEDSATDGDIDIAFALLQASKKWNNPQYSTLAQTIMDGIWANNVTLIGDNYYLLASDNATREDGFLVNPSYYSPAMFRIFAKGTTNQEQNWNKLTTDTYSFLKKARNPQTGLVPNWSIVTPTEQVTSAKKYIESGSDDYSYDAFRTNYRVALDKMWFNSSESDEYISFARKNFFENHWYDKYNFGSVYSTDGKQIQDYSDISTSAGVIAIFNDDPSLLDTEIYLNTLKNQERNDYWSDSNNYYDQNWGWFATAMYGDKLENYWK